MRGIKDSVVEVYSDQAHFIYELLQNANDANATKSSFQLTKEGLYFRHNGKILFSVTDPNNEDTASLEVQYVDHEEVALDVTAVNENLQRERIIKHIEDSKTLEQLTECLPGISDDDLDLIIMYDDKKKELTPKKK